METLEKQSTYLKDNYQEFFEFMQKKYPVYKDSNIFLRDVQYAIYLFFLNKGLKLKYPECENLAVSLVESLSNDNKLKKISSTTWKMNFSVTPDVIEINN